MSEEQKQAGRGIKWLIVAIPIWLALSGGVGLWLHFRQEEKNRQKQEHAYRKDIDGKSLADDFTKMVDLLGPRHDKSDAARQSLQRMASMIEGAMGLSNIGYEVTRAAGRESQGVSAPVLMADVLRRKTEQEIWLIVPYDSPPQLPRGQSSASAVAVSLAVAQSLVGRDIDHNIRFLFLPAGFAEEQERLDAAAQVKRLIGAQGTPRLVLVVGGMLHGGKLSVVSRDAGSPTLREMQELVSVAEDASICLQDDGEFSSLLAEMNLPAVLIGTFPQEPMTAEQEDAMPAAKNLMTQSAAELVALLLQLADDVQKK
jgi:hypothetical protein